MKIILVILILVSSLPFVRTRYGVKFVKLKTGCYHFSSYPASWFEALNICSQMNSTLLTIESPEESCEISLHVHRKLPRDALYWTSGTNAFRIGRYMWMYNGQALGYREWCLGEERSVRSDKNGCQVVECVAFDHSRNRNCWRQIPCHARSWRGVTLSFVCEHLHCWCDHNNQPYLREEKADCPDNQIIVKEDY